MRGKRTVKQSFNKFYFMTNWQNYEWRRCYEAPVHFCVLKLPAGWNGKSPRPKKYVDIATDADVDADADFPSRRRTQSLGRSTQKNLLGRVLNIDNVEKETEDGFLKGQTWLEWHLGQVGPLEVFHFTLIACSFLEQRTTLVYLTVVKLSGSCLAKKLVCPFKQPNFVS